MMSKKSEGEQKTRRNKSPKKKEGKEGKRERGGLKSGESSVIFEGLGIREGERDARCD